MKLFYTALTFVLLLNLNLNAQTPGNSLQFDGTGDYVSTAIPTLFSNIVANDFSVETWVKPQGSTTQRIFFAQFDATHFASILLNGSNVPYVYVYNGATFSANTNVSLVTGQWTHLAFTWDASLEEIQVYYNGVLQTTVDGGTSSGGLNNMMAIGAKTDGSQNLSGELDEFRIWDYVLTPCEITTRMNSEYTVAPVGLVAYYNFNQGTAGGANAGITSLPDFTTNYNGTLNNFALTGATSNWLASAAAISLVNQETEVTGATELVSLCDEEYTWSANSTVYSVSGIYTETLTSVLGCDSIVTLDLTLNSVDSSVTQTGFNLMANEVGGTYQWLDCSNSFSVVSGAINQSFTPTANGDYAVLVSANGCEDTSACFTIAGLGYNTLFNENLSVYPNPTSGQLNLNLGKNYSEVIIRIRNQEGKLLEERNEINSEIIQLNLDGNNGFYFVEIISNQGIDIIKVVKQ